MTYEDIIVLILAGIGILVLALFVIILGGYVLGKIKEMKDD